MAATWCEYVSDWQAETFARRVDDNVVAVGDLGWTASSGAADNEMPQHLKPRMVHVINPDTGQRLSLAIQNNGAAVYSIGAPNHLTYKGITYTIVGFTGEKRSIAR